MYEECCIVSSSPVPVESLAEPPSVKAVVEVPSDVSVVAVVEVPSDALVEAVVEIAVVETVDTVVEISSPVSEVLLLLSVTHGVVVSIRFKIQKRSVDFLSSILHVYILIINFEFTVDLCFSYHSNFGAFDK